MQFVAELDVTVRLKDEQESEVEMNLARSETPRYQEASQEWIE